MSRRGITLDEALVLLLVALVISALAVYALRESALRNGIQHKLDATTRTPSLTPRELEYVSAAWGNDVSKEYFKRAAAPVSTGDGCQVAVLVRDGKQVRSVKCTVFVPPGTRPLDALLIPPK